MKTQKCGGPCFGSKLNIEDKLDKNGLVMRVKDRLNSIGGQELGIDVYQTKGGDINFVAKHLHANNIVISSCQVENEKSMAHVVKEWAKTIPAFVHGESKRLASKCKNVVI